MLARWSKPRTVSDAQQITSVLTTWLRVSRTLAISGKGRHENQLIEEAKTPTLSQKARQGGNLKSI
jgi:hypothetical protein